MNYAALEYIRCYLIFQLCSRVHTRHLKTLDELFQKHVFTASKVLSMSLEESSSGLFVFAAPYGSTPENVEQLLRIRK